MKKDKIQEAYELIITEAEMTESYVLKEAIDVIKSHLSDKTAIDYTSVTIVNKMKKIVKMYKWVK